jgi:hypothetical protein
VPILACGPEFVEKPTAATNISSALVQADLIVVVSAIRSSMRIPYA